MIDYKNGEPINLSVPVQKIDKERRLVSGFATLDNIDLQGDIVLASAAKKSFEEFIGNLRLMHQPIPVGKVISFKDDVYIDKDGKAYGGVYVTAYVSKGAEPAWQMVLDETLTGFSIGGTVTDHETVIQDGKAVRVIKAMKIVELSLVDSPANQHAKILEIHKSSDGTMKATGMSSGLKLEDLFYCKEDEILMPGPKDSNDCLKCGDKMENIGWIENLDIKTDREEMNKMLSEYLNKTSEPFGPENAASLQKNEGGKTMEKETLVSEEIADVEKAVEVEASEEVIEKTVDAATDTEAPVVAVEEVLEKVAADSAEELVVEDTTDGLEKSVGSSTEVPPGLAEEVKALLMETLTNFASTQTEAVEKVFAEALKATDTKIEEFKAELLESVTKSLDNVGERVAELEGNTAIKKSGELGGSRDSKIEKSESVWNGAFSPNGRFLSSNSILQ